MGLRYDPGVYAVAEAKKIPAWRIARWPDSAVCDELCWMEFRRRRRKAAEKRRKSSREDAQGTPMERAAAAGRSRIKRASRDFVKTGRRPKL